MPWPPRVPDEEFKAIWDRTGGSPCEVARVLNLGERAVFSRRRRLEERGYELPAGRAPVSEVNDSRAYASRIECEVEDGVVAVFSDRHWWPGDGISPAEAAMLALLPRLRPKIIVANGDVYEGAAQSKHAPLGWEKKPDAASEIEAMVAGMRRIEDAWPGARRIRTVGNHDRRYDYKLASVASDYRGISGTRLRDHLPAWEEAWSCHVNPGLLGGHTVIKHKLGGGVTAARGNAMKAGVHVVTGHTHALDCARVEDYAGRRYSVQCGTLSDTRAPAFEYGEDQPNPGRSGFVVLTYSAGLLLPPELVEVDDAGVGWFRSEPVTLRFRVKAGTSAL